MAFNQGEATIDFGAFPGSNEASIAVADATITDAADAEAYVMGDDTSGTHTANDHRYLRALGTDFTCGEAVAGVGFTIYGRSVHKLQGTFKLRWVWSDGA